MATKKKTTAKKDKKPYKIIKKGSGRYAVKGAKGKFINGVEKVAILLGEGLIKTKLPAKKEEAATSES